MGMVRRLREAAFLQQVEPQEQGFKASANKRRCKVYMYGINVIW